MSSGGHRGPRNPSPVHHDQVVLPISGGGEPPEALLKGAWSGGEQVRQLPYGWVGCCRDVVVPGGRRDRYPMLATVDSPSLPACGFLGVVAHCAEPLAVARTGCASVGDAHDMVRVPHRCIAPGGPADFVSNNQEMPQLTVELASPTEAQPVRATARGSA